MKNIMDIVQEEQLKEQQRPYPLHYISDECPNCGRLRVEHWSNGKDICEKCHWCIQDNEYYWEVEE